MATLGELLAFLAPDAPAPAGADVAVSWVRVLRARVPALDVLEPGDLVIVPATSLDVVAPAPADLRDLAQTLARSGASGLLLVPAVAVNPAFAAQEGLAARDVLGELEAEAREAGLAAVRVERIDTPALERRLIGYLVDRRGELERQAAVLEGDLAKLAMAERGIDALAAAIGGFLRRAVALEGRRGDVLTVHAPTDAPDAAAAVTAYLARPAATGRRVPLPGAPGERAPAGWLVLLGDRLPSALESIVAERIAPLLSLQLVLEAQVRRVRDEGGRGETLPADGPPWVVLVARQPAPGPGEPTREETRRGLRIRFAARRMALRGTSESLDLRAVAAPGPDDPLGLRMAAQVAEFLARPVGLSLSFAEGSARPAQEAAARVALETVERMPQPPNVARADHVPAYRILGALGNLPHDRVHARALLEPLLDGRPAAVGERLATLRAVLDHPGASEAASALGVHRNTLAYRVRNLEARTGWSLDDPEFRLALAIALRIVQSALIRNRADPDHPTPSGNSDR